MKFTKAAYALAVTTTLAAQNHAFSPTAFNRARSRGSMASGVTRHPTRGNVSRRKIKAWHKLYLEPWAGLKLSSAVDESTGVVPTDNDDGVNGKVEKALIMDAAAITATEEEKTGGAEQLERELENEVEGLKASFDAIRADATRYLSTFEGQNGASIIYSKLVEHGVETVNGYSGGAVLPLLDQFSDNNPRHGGKKAPIRWITNSNESSAGHVAEGIAKTSTEADGKLAAGVVIATSGPGMTNLITPMQDAICDGVPMVVLCGQAATNAPADAFQGAPALELATPCTKWSYQIKSAAELPFVLDYAFYVARNGRPGPVFVDLPKDLQVQTLTHEAVLEYVENELVFGEHIPRGDTYIADHMPNNQPPLVRLQAIKDEGTQKHDVAITVGNKLRGVLPFYVGKDRLEPVPITSACKYNGVDAYRWDHTPSNRIYTKNKKEGEGFSSKTMDEMMKMIQKAHKPVIIAGQGCNDSSAELTAFAEKLQIPVCTTLHGLGCFDERHPLALNMLGMHGHPTPNFMIQESDLVICIGSRFDDRITGRQDAFVPEARKAAIEGRGGVIHVDLRLSEQAKQIEPTYFVHSMGKTFLQEVNAYLDKQTDIEPMTKTWLTQMSLLQKEYPVGIPHFPTQEFTNSETGETISKTPMSAQSVVAKLNEKILEKGVMDDCLFTTGVGIHQMVTAQLLTWTKPRQMVSSGSLGTMGVSLGYCIGAQLANGKKMCISIDGDGSFNMTFTELKTVAEQKIPVKLMILDNECQMMVEYWQKLFFDERYIAVRNSQNPKYTTLADAFGIKHLYCDNEEELEEKMKQFLFDDPGEPVLFHVRIERTPCLPLVAPGQALDSMILEDDSTTEIDKSAAPS